MTIPADIDAALRAMVETCPVPARLIELAEALTHDLDGLTQAEAVHIVAGRRQMEWGA